MQVHNEDVFPRPNLLDAYAPVLPLLVNPVVDDAFSAAEKIAVESKLKYHRRGRLGVSFVLISTMLTLGLAFFSYPFTGRTVFGVCAIVCGVAGMAAQIQLLLSKTKQTWLLNRFAAERLRSIKFQAFALATVATSTEDLKEQADAFHRTEVARLTAELNAADAALARFSPRASIRSPLVQPADAPGDAELAATASNAYRDLRIDYQRRFAADEIEALKRSQSLGSTVADILYLTGVGLTLCAVGATICPYFANWGRCIDFLALSFFILGLLKAIMDNASLGDTTQGRYEDYIRALEESADDLRRENARFPEIVQRIERVALGELADFCEAALRITYRL